MTRRGAPGRVAFAAAAVIGAMALGACSAAPAPPATTRSASTSAPPRSGTVTSGGAGTATTSPSTTTTALATANLVVTGEIRSELTAAGAALNSLPASAYTGLRPGETYYAYDATTQTYWASAGLVPSASSMQAQVSTQDDGAYLLFSRPAGGTWKAHAVGLAGTPEGSPCPIAVPAAVLQLWHWAAGSCRPATIS